MRKYHGCLDSIRISRESEYEVRVRRNNAKAPQGVKKIQKLKCQRSGELLTSWTSRVHLFIIRRFTLFTEQTIVWNIVVNRDINSNKQTNKITSVQRNERRNKPIDNTLKCDSIKKNTDWFNEVKEEDICLFCCCFVLWDREREKVSILQDIGWFSSNVSHFLKTTMKKGFGRISSKQLEGGWILPSTLSLDVLLPWLDLPWLERSFAVVNNLLLSLNCFAAINLFYSKTLRVVRNNVRSTKHRLVVEKRLFSCLRFKLWTRFIISVIIVTLLLSYSYSSGIQSNASVLAQKFCCGIVSTKSPWFVCACVFYNQKKDYMSGKPDVLKYRRRRRRRRILNSISISHSNNQEKVGGSENILRMKQRQERPIKSVRVLKTRIYLQIKMGNWKRTSDKMASHQNPGNAIAAAAEWRNSGTNQESIEGVVAAAAAWWEGRRPPVLWAVLPPLRSSDRAFDGNSLFWSQSICSTENCV